MNELNEIIQKKALENENNLKIAFVTAVQSYDKIKESIIKNFIEKLKQQLRKDFPEDGWIYKEGDGLFSLSIRNKKWHKETTLGIDDYDKDRAHFYVQTGKQNSDLYKKINEQVKGGKYNEWNWWLLFENELNKWDKDFDSMLTLYRVAIMDEKPEDNYAIKYITKNLKDISVVINDIVQ